MGENDNNEELYCELSFGDNDDKVDFNGSCERNVFFASLNNISEL